MATHDPYVLPDGLPVPEDDGAADHLPGLELPDLTLDSSQGPVSLAELARERLVLYVYPRTGRPDRPMLPGWDDIPGARGCTPQSCGFRDHAAELAAFGARVAGLSAQSLADQVEFAERNRMPFPVVSDERLELARALDLPTFEVEGLTLYKRLALVAERGRIVTVFYPVFPPDGTRRRCSRGCRRARDGARGARRAPLPRAPGLGVDRARRGRIRGDDEPTGAPAARARRGGAVLDARGRPRGLLARRHREDALPHARRPPGGGGAHALPGRAPLDLPLFPVRLPAHVHVLRHRADALPPQPDRLGDPRPGAPLPPARGRGPRRLHGHGRADVEPRRGARGHAAAAGPRHHPSPHDRLDRRLAAGAAPLRRRGRGAGAARALAARADRRAAQRADARERALSARRARPPVHEVLRPAPTQGLRRVRDARGRERPLRAGAGAGPAAEPALLP